ncbi:MAG: hypothetical protein KGH66_00840 [Candidatus Micrarchaeota archaeon]|nr:hypothetical protein [Candidatus Micrarchaeota archaeon]
MGITKQQTEPFSEREAMRAYVRSQIVKAVGTLGIKSDGYHTLSRLGTLDLIRAAGIAANGYKLATSNLSNEYRNELRSELMGEDRVRSKSEYFCQLVTILFIIKERASHSIPTPEAKYKQASEITTSEILSSMGSVSESGDRELADRMLAGIRHTGYHMAAVETIFNAAQSRYAGDLAETANRFPTNLVNRAIYHYGGKLEKVPPKVAEKNAQDRKDILYSALYILNCGVKTTTEEGKTRHTAYIDYAEVALTLGPYVSGSTETIVKDGQHAGINVTIKQIAGIKKRAQEDDGDEEEMVLRLLGTGEKIINRIGRR